jgi:Amt family ammonium transporter
MQSGNVAWVLVGGALVLFMTPGLAFFYGGMTRTKNVLNMLMMNFWCVLVVPLLWAVVGYSLAFRGDGPLIGNFSAAFLRGLDFGSMEPATMIFLATFAAITPALISGAVADRIRFAAWAIFVPIWSLLVYVPITHWVFAPHGWLRARGSLDFAGGTAIHVNAGIAALVAVLVLGRRKGWPKEGAPPHSMPLVMLGTGILWFGWFGFNAGSELAADGVAIQAFINTFLAAAAAGLVWALVERVRDGHFTNLGVASGIVAGLVAITPACGFVTSMSAVAIGAAAGVVCCYAVRIKFRFGFDDALDVVGVHFMGGLVGSLLIGLFADPQALGYTVGRGVGPDGALRASEGLFFGGGIRLLAEQALANGAAIAYSVVVTFLILKVLGAFVPLRVSSDEEREGLDINEHAERAYHDADTLTGLGGLGVGAHPVPSPGLGVGS